jgi:cytochrome c biogenesis protein CcmG/thiol:disulfide interchange protein DsbE
MLLLVLPVLAGCTLPEPALRARAGDLVVVDLQAWDAAGGLVVNASALRAVNGDHVPVALPEGWDPNATQPLPRGVRAVLTGLAPGEERSTALLPPEQGYGPWRAERTIEVPQRAALSRVQRLPASTAFLEHKPTGGGSGPGDASVTWAHARWDVDFVDASNATVTVRLLNTPTGALLELPDFWNDGVRLWRSRVLGGDAENLSVEHLAEPGTVLVGGQPYRVAVANGTVLADGNHPLAREALRFRVALRGVAFAGGGAFPPAPDGALADLEGRAFRLSDLRGKPALLDFYATWCLTCKQQAPVLARAHAAHPGLAVVSVTIDPTDTPARVRAFQEDVAPGAPGLSLNWTWASDPSGEVAPAFGVARIPRGVLLDAEGRVRSASVGLHPWEELEAELAALPAA